ncbi:MAG TPA: hypothetical protein VFB54_01985 [Burkholderiales bacterium]|nr:hypothetical protein [Burkholderiales bacterium]
MIHRILVLLLLALPGAPAVAHDPSAWGGTYRTRDFGQSWLSADAGLFIGGSLDLAVSPTDSNHLLYATDTRLLRSRNGGRDWVQEAPAQFYGPTLAVAFLADGKGAIAANAAGVFRSEDGTSWQPAAIPDIALPVRRLAVTASRVFALGARGVFVSSDQGRTFQRVGAHVLPEQAASGIAVQRDAMQSIWIASAGDLFRSGDGQEWSGSMAGLPKGRVEAVFADPSNPRRLWCAGADQIFLSDDDGSTWRAMGRPLPDPGTSIRALAVDATGQIILLATHRGLLRSADGGNSWSFVEGGTLPVHLEAGVLRGDPNAAQVWYVGFSLMPYAEVWRRAEEGTNLLSQVDPLSLAGLAAFLVLLLIGGALLARHLSRAQRLRAP